MSTPLDRASDRDRPSLYAPKWARKGTSDRRDVAPMIREDRSSPDDDAQPAASPRRPDDGSADHSLVIERFRVPRSLEPTVMSEPWSQPRGRSVLGMWTRLFAAISAAAIVALFVAGRISPNGTSDRIAEASPAPIATRSVMASSTAGEQPVPPAPQLIVVAGTPRRADDLIPLGISVSDAGVGASVVVSGLPAGSSMTTGRPFGVDAWRLSAADLGNAIVRPPHGFVGAADLAAELRRSDDTVADRRALHLEWLGTVANGAAAPAPAPAPRRLDPEEVATLIKRGEQFVANGDLAAARLLLQRAAEAQDPHAALALAATYDPIVLAQLGVQGLTADAATARAWYEKARQFGSAEASRRLELLASSNR